MQDATLAEIRQTDVMDPARAQALLATLDLPGKIAAGDPLPAFFHQIYFWEPQPPGALGRDGHPAVGSGGLIPDLGLPRRMWAGGQLTFHQPLRVGQPAEKRSRVTNVARKTGRSGPLGFVTLTHEIWQEDTLCITDVQDLVYRNDPDPAAPVPTPPRAPDDETERLGFEANSTRLFRYSALTFNGHRIHYDAAYAREVEGYAGLVVHGPLLAQCLMLMAEKHAPLRKFEFRGNSPLFDDETAHLCRNLGQMWVRAQDGRMVMSAKATW
jgi:3-methylfumaryl-CoA hydratase